MREGGHVELDEDPNYAAIREVKEETGLTVQLVPPQSNLPSFPSKNHTELLPPRFMNRYKISDTHEHITLVFFATTGNDNIIDIDNYEKSGVGNGQPYPI